jgi:hypothetical protein
MLLPIHNLLSNMVSIYALLAGAFAAYYFVTRRPPGGNLWGVLAIAEGLFATQVLVGVLLALSGAPLPTRFEIHILYGLSTLLTLPLVYLITRRRSPVFTTGLFCVALFFIWGLAQRAVETAAR